MKPQFRKRRRLIIQLAALVDLLFVVMFLLYTDQSRTAAEQSGRLQLAATEAERSRAGAEELKKMVLDDQERLRAEN
jgi:F0F1-type ATP synthase membrane subunit b/b'